MKNIKYMLVNVFLALFLFGCNYALDIDPITQQTDRQFYKSESDAFQAMVAVYDVLQWGAPQGQNCPFEVVSEQIADCCYGGGGNVNDVPFIVAMSRWQMDPYDATYKALWWKYYAGIFRANIFLEKIDKIEFKDPEKKKRMIAEVRFLRGNYYFDLVRLFGNVPLILTSLTPAEYYKQVQASPEDVYGQVRKDMEFAIKNGLPDNVPTKEKGRITKYAAEAMLTRAWLYYTGAYGKTDLEGLTKTEIIAYIEDVVNNSGCQLMPDFADLWKIENKNSVESVFEIQYSNKSNWGDWGYREGADGNQSIILWGIREPDKDSPYASGWSFAPVRVSLWNEYNPLDKRRGATIINAAEEGLAYTAGYQNTGFFNRKYTALKSNNPNTGSRELNFPNNYISIRFADVLLMASELQLDVNISKAQGYYSQVVKRALGETFNVPTVTKELLMKERLLELALEGHRYWDLRRQGLNVAKAAIEKENPNVTNDFKKTFDLKYEGLMPLPQTQVTMSKLKQNNGY